MNRPLAIYIHWPFCAHKCPYCDFNSHVRDHIDQDAWVRGYVRELQYYRALTGPRPISSVFFGGGTPSLMNPLTAGIIIETIGALWGYAAAPEITIEANPTSVEIEKLRAFRDAGVNRVSIGIQSFKSDDLKFLGRQHDVAAGLAAIETAATIFDRFSFDLIYARPGQTPDMWAQELNVALALKPAHLSLYQLTIEEHTPFHTAYHRGDFSIPDEDAASELYTLTDHIMTAAGLPAYEVSNYAGRGQESRHNLTYWQYGDYVGIGPGAHGRITLNGIKYATRGHRAPEIWLDWVNVLGHGAHPFILVAARDRAIESLMMGLRLTSGFDLNKLTSESGHDWRDIIAPERLMAMLASGDITKENDRIIATLPGRLRLNKVISYLAGV